MSGDNQFEQIPFGAAEFADNPEPRCPCVLLVDSSYSMMGAPIQALNEGLIHFKNDLMADNLALKRVEIAIVSFGPVKVENDFQSADHFIPPKLSAEADTPMGGAIERAIDLLEKRKQGYRAHGIPYFRPWIFMITDGSPTDEWRAAADRVHQGEANKSFAFFSVGVHDADMETLAEIAVRQPVRLQGLKFRELFQWLSASMRSVSHSVPGDIVPLEDPSAGPRGWASV